MLHRSTRRVFLAGVGAGVAREEMGSTKMAPTGDSAAVETAVFRGECAAAAERTAVGTVAVVALGKPGALGTTAAAAWVEAAAAA